MTRTHGQHGLISYVPLSTFSFFFNNIVCSVPINSGMDPPLFNLRIFFNFFD